MTVAAPAPVVEPVTSVGDAVDLASLYAEWGHLRIAPYRAAWRARGAPGLVRDWEAHWLAEAADALETACAAFAFAAMERAKEGRNDAR